MNIKTITRRALPVLTGAAALVCASNSHAVSFDFKVLDSYIEVGEGFDVAFTATFDTSLEVVSFAFDLDPLATLLGDGIIELASWSVPAPLWEFSAGPPEVGALGDPFAPMFGGTDVLLATLRFTALSAGSDIVEVSGLPNLGQGLDLYDFDANAFESHDIASRFSVSVNAVPDSSHYGALPFVLIGMAAFLSRRLGKRGERIMR